MKSGDIFFRWMAAVVLTGISICAFAKSYPLYICNIQVTDGNRQELTTLLTQLGCLKSGSISFDGDKTLVLDNVVVEYAEKGIAHFLSNGKSSDFEGIPIEGGVEDFVVKVVGTNIVTVTAQTDIIEEYESTPYAMSIAFMMVSDNSSFEGTGSLTINARCEDNTLDFAAGYALMEFGNCKFRGGTYNFKGKTSGLTVCDKVFFENGDFTFTSEDYAAVNGSEEDLILSPFMKWITPENPTFDDGVVCNASGVPAKTVKIGPGEGLDLYVGGQRVTASNFDDILGDGCVYYDYTSNKLTLDGATVTTYEAGIDAVDFDGLTVELKGNNVIGGFGSDKCPYISFGKNATVVGNDNAKLSVRVRDGIYFIDKLTFDHVNMDVHGAYHAFNGSATESYQTAELEAVNYTTIDAFNEYDYEPVMNRLVLTGDEVTAVLLPANAVSQPDLLQYYDGRHVVVGNPGRYYNVAVCGWNFCAGNKSYIEEGLTTQGFLTSGSIGFDETSNTLRLDGVTLTSLMDNPVIEVGCNFSWGSEQVLNVELRGKNIINSGRTSGIYIETEKMTLSGYVKLSTFFKGGGSLAINAGYSLFSGAMAGIETEGTGPVSFVGGTYNLKGLGFGLKTGGPLLINAAGMTAEGDDCGMAFNSLQLENAAITMPQEYTINEHYSYKSIGDEYGNDAKKVIVTSSMPTTIKSTDRPSNLNEAGHRVQEWRTLDGRQLNAKPLQKGVYILDGRKVVLK